MADVEIENAMLVWDSDGRVAVVRHPDLTGGSDDYDHSVGACMAYWRKLDTQGQQLQLMIDAWHGVAFYGVPIDAMKAALVVIPEYRDMLASDCLSRQF